MSSPVSELPAQQEQAAAQAERPRRFFSQKAAGADAQGGSSTALVSGSAAPARRVAPLIPDDITTNASLNEAIALLPSNYSFEVHKTVWRIRSSGAKRVALQFPEGLLLFACPIVDILTRFCGCSCIVMGDVAYGACCVDDIGAKAMGCDLLVHYGHSCLVPVDNCELPVLYVFVDISIDMQHLAATVKANFTHDQRICCVSTIQFIQSAHRLKELLPEFVHLSLPQAKPLSRGEILGCTSPQLGEGACDALLYIGDGRFHIESIMIANPRIPAFRYDPYAKVLSRETYDHETMQRVRRQAISTAAKAHVWGIIVGTLGRQGNVSIVNSLVDDLTAAGKDTFVVLLSEIFPSKLALFSDVEAWVQVACPRLSIDWGRAFAVPLLTAYEAKVALGVTQWKETYPMDFYARGEAGGSGGSWSNYAVSRTHRLKSSAS
jgi:2-(3-amino-3-carboxypropyl)histidine synthase